MCVTKFYLGQQSEWRRRLDNGNCKRKERESKKEKWKTGTKRLCRSGRWRSQVFPFAFVFLAVWLSFGQNIIFPSFLLFVFCLLAVFNRSMEWRQHHHEPSTIGAATVYARSCSSPSLMNGPLDAGHGKSSSNNRPPRPPRPPLAGWPSPSSSSLSSSFYRSASLETIEKNRRLRQLALQSTSRVRSVYLTFIVNNLMGFFFYFGNMQI